MKILITPLLLLFSFNLFAGIPTVNVSNFQGQFSNGNGQANADRFEIPNIDFGDGAVSFVVEQQQGSILLRANEQEYLWQNPPSFIGDVDILEWSGVGLTSSGSSVGLSLGTLKGSSEEQEINVNIGGFSLTCNLGRSSSDIVSELLKLCINKSSRIKANILQFGDTSLEQPDFVMRNNALNFTIKVDGIRIKGEGRANFYEDRQEIVFRVDKAKAGPLNVTKRFFNEIKPLENEFIKIERPNITISLQKAVN